MVTTKREMLSWYETRRCWRKKYKGHSYYVGTGGTGPNDMEAYQRALCRIRRHQTASRCRAFPLGRAGKGAESPYRPQTPPPSTENIIDEAFVVGYGDWSSLQKELPASASLASAERTLDELYRGVWVKSYYDSAVRGGNGRYRRTGASPTQSTISPTTLVTSRSPI